MVISTTPGAEVQKPLATVVIGGLITATLLTLIILPVFYIIFSSFSIRSIFRSKSMSKIISVLLILSGFSLLNTAKAQQSRPIDLKQAIQLALDSNLAVRSSVYSVDIEKALKGASLDLPKTSIDGQYGQFNSYSKDNSFAVSQSFSFPTVYLNQNALANASIKSSEWQLKATQLDISTQVKQVYWQLVYLGSKQKLLAFQDSIYSGFLKAAELKAKAGETNQLEMISVRSQSLEVKNEFQQLKTDQEICRQKLKTILNSAITYYPEDSILHRMVLSVKADSESVLENPGLGFLQQQVEISRLEKKIERSQLMPEFTIQTMRGEQEIEGVPRTFGKGDRFTGIQAGISIPVWFIPYTSRTKASGLKELAARTNASYYLNSVMSDYRVLLGEYSKFSKSVEYYENQAVPEADLIIDQSSRSYKSGAIDYMDYVLNLNRALTIRQGYLDALNDCNQTIILIELITGKIF
jgi:cobalt-zinc-cadmium resistance protein CzcA